MINILTIDWLIDIFIHFFHTCPILASWHVLITQADAFVCEVSVWLAGAETVACRPNRKKKICCVEQRRFQQDNWHCCHNGENSSWIKWAVGGSGVCLVKQPMGLQVADGQGVNCSQWGYRLQTVKVLIAANGVTGCRRSRC
jgi:hypothetical protein